MYGKARAGSQQKKGEYEVEPHRDLSFGLVSFIRKLDTSMTGTGRDESFDWGQDDLVSR